MRKQGTRRLGSSGRQKSHASRLSGGGLGSGAIHQSAGSLAESEPVPQAAFYQRCGFWMILIIIMVVSPWAYLAYTNEGCPEYTIIETLQLDQFLGKWYEQFVSNLEGDDDEGDKHCGMLNLQVKSDYVVHTARSHTYSPVGQRPQTYEAQGKIRWPHPPYGHLQQKTESFEGWSNFDIMETDYVNYAVMYQCQTRWLGASTFQKMWVLVRQPTPADSNLWREYKRVAFQAISRGFINATTGQAFASEEVMVRKKQGGSFCNYPPDPVAEKMNNEEESKYSPKMETQDVADDEDQDISYIQQPTQSLLQTADPALNIQSTSSDKSIPNQQDISTTNQTHFVPQDSTKQEIAQTNGQESIDGILNDSTVSSSKIKKGRDTQTSFLQ